jgi:hypothetical protein
MTRPATTSVTGTSHAVVPHRTLDQLVLDIHKKFRRTIEAHEKFKAARIECGRDLLELRRRIEAGEAGKIISWWEWYESKFTRDRRDAERVMAIAAAEDPVAAHEAEKAATRERMRALRARPVPVRGSRPSGAHWSCAPEPTVNGGEVLPPDPTQDDIIIQIIDLFKQLNRQAQVRCGVKLRNIMRGEA